MICNLCYSIDFQWIREVPASNFLARRRRVIKACIGLLVAAGTCWLLGYLVSCIPASWSPICYKLDDEVIACPNMSLPSIPFVPPKVDVISMWTMSHRLSSFSIRLAVRIFFRNVGSLVISFFFIFIRASVMLYSCISFCS